MTDPDANYFNTSKRLGHLEDWGPESAASQSPTVPVEVLVAEAVREATSSSSDGLAGQPLISNASIDPDSADGKERVEWQTMLASVLGGEILKGESSRIGVEKPSNETFRKELGQTMWWQIRARMRGRTEDEEKRRVEERRARVVDAVLEEVDKFVIRVTPTTEGVPSENTALDQVAYILHKISVVEALYPHHLSLRIDKPLYDSPAFQARVDALTAWYTVVTSLQAQLQILQKWTGTDELDITKPNTTKEKALVGKNRYHPLDAKAKAMAQSAGDQVADDSTFVERVMKEDNLQKTFEKRVFVDLLAHLRNARETVITHSPMFEKLQLPKFSYELVRLVGFPGRLVIEALRVRLDAAHKLQEPNIMVIDDMIDSFRLTISLAVLIRKQYEEMVAPDPDEHWQIPECLASDYNAVLLNSLGTFFRLLHWKLKSGSKAIYFRETEVLEDEWEFLYEAAEAIRGGDLVVAELFWYVNHGRADPVPLPTNCCSASSTTLILKSRSRLQLGD
jgi:mitogen-activated protein kinase kinase kinase